MKILLFILIMLTAVDCSPGETVYVCDGPNSQKYHYKENCRGLSSCQYHIKKTTLENAKKENKTLCKWEQSN